MKKLFFLFAALLFLATSCDDDQVLGDTSTVNLNFKAVYGGDPLVCQNADFQYKYPDGREIRFTSFEFFISEVVLLEEEGGDEAELIDIEYVNFSDNSTLEESEMPITLSPNNIPAGNYKGMRIGIGVPAELNNDSASQFASTHPLRKHGDFWSGWGSFIFMKIGGSYDIDENGLGNGDDVAITHHLGSDAMYRTVTFSEPLVLEPGQPLDLNILLDVKKLYEVETDNYLDLTLEHNRVTHDPDDVTAATFITGNFDNAFTLE